MATGKQYKNVYTILEKVKKGEIQSYYNDSEGLFGKLNFYKKPDLIKPYVHYIDEKKIDGIVDSAFMTDHTRIKQEYEYFARTAGFQKLPEDQKPDYNKFYAALREKYEKFPKHLKYDIFKMYYNKMDKLEFEERSAANHTRFKFLEKANNPVGKIMSEGGNLKSSIFTRNMMMYYLMQMTQLEYIDPNAAQDLQNGLNGESEFDNDAADKAMDKMMNSPNSKNALDRAMKDAQDTCKMMDEHMGQDIQEEMFDQAYKSGGNQAGKMSPDYMRTIAGKLADIRLSMGSLKEKLKKLLDKSTSYFSSRKITTYEDLFNAQDVSGLEDYELLHPKLRKIFAEDVQVKETKAVGKIDVYVDVSGSMSSNCGTKHADGSHISRIDFAKSMIAKLKEMDMLNDVYLFDTRLKKHRNDLVSISMIDCGGGTTIDVAVNNIQKIGRNGLVITDAEDCCTIFSEHAFFIGLQGARFNNFNSDVIKQYSNRGQALIFDGEKIFKVDQKGKLVQ